MINLSRVVLSPHLSQRIDVHRVSGSWVRGEWVLGDEETLTMRGIVTIASAKDLEQVPEGDRMTGAMRFLTVERKCEHQRLHYLARGEVPDCHNIS